MKITPIGPNLITDRFFTPNKIKIFRNVVTRYCRLHQRSCLLNIIDVIQGGNLKVQRFFKASVFMNVQHQLQSSIWASGLTVQTANMLWIMFIFN